MLELISFILVSIVIVAAIITTASCVIWILLDSHFWWKMVKVFLAILLISATTVAIFYSLLELYRYGPLV